MDRLGEALCRRLLSAEGSAPRHSVVAGRRPSRLATSRSDGVVAPRRSAQRRGFLARGCGAPWAAPRRRQRARLRLAKRGVQPAAPFAGSVLESPPQAERRTAPPGPQPETPRGGTPPNAGPRPAPRRNPPAGKATDPNRAAPEPYSAHYDDYGRQVGRTDYTSQPDPSTHTNPHHTPPGIRPSALDRREEKQVRFPGPTRSIGKPMDSLSLNGQLRGFTVVLRACRSEERTKCSTYDLVLHLARVQRRWLPGDRCCVRGSHESLSVRLWRWTHSQLLHLHVIDVGHHQRVSSRLPRSHGAGTRLAFAFVSACGDPSSLSCGRRPENVSNLALGWKPW